MNKKISLKNTKLIPLIFCLILTFIIGISFTNVSSYDKFKSICNTLLSEELSQDSLSLHFTLAAPEQYHISTSKITFPSLKKEDRIKQTSNLEEYMNSISNLKTEHWSYPQKLSLEVILSSISGSLEGEQFLYFYEPFSGSHGIQSEYPMLLFEYAFRNEKDIQQYLKLLEATPEYFESMIAFERERLSNGHIFSESNAEIAIKACDNFASAKDAFITTFENKMQPFINENVISSRKFLKFLILISLSMLSPLFFSLLV